MAKLINKKEKNQFYPESFFKVKIDDIGVTVIRPDTRIESIKWRNLKAVLIENTDKGPIQPDIFWLLIGENEGCVIPQGATGEMELLKRLQNLPNFDNQAVIDSASCAENKTFLCWKKDDANQ